MSKYYGEVIGNRGPATRCGSKEIKACAMSWDGSVIVRLRDKKDWELAKDGRDFPIVQIEIEVDDSSPYGELMFEGTIQELIDKLSE